MSRLIGFGASSMQGVGDSQGGFFTRLSRSFQENKILVEMRNEGIGGNTTRDMLARMDKLAPFQPYDLIVILGCNDMPRERDGNPKARTSRSGYLSNLQKLLGTIRGKRSLFISSFSVSEERTGVSSTLFDDYMNAAMETARSFDYDIWDLYAETKGKTEPLLAADGLHFNDQGHAFLMEKVKAWYLAQ